MVEQQVERVAAALHARGERMTGPRRAVVRALTQLPGHPTSEEVITQVARVDATVHRASVYRTLDVLRDLGVVVHVHLGHGGTAYQLRDADRPGHVHGQCQHCGDLVDLPVPPLDRARASLLASTGFELEPGHAVLLGTCSDCGTSGERADAERDASDLAAPRSTPVS